MSNRVLLASLLIVTVTSLVPLPLARAASFPRRVNAGDHPLILNGLGVRKKALLQLYVGGLYLTERTSHAESVIAADHPMAIKIEITSIFVSQSSMVSAIDEGFHKSTGGSTSSIQNEIEQFKQCFTEKISKGDIFDIVYIPAMGVVVMKNGQQKGTIKGLAFKQALFGIWLCDNPADLGLKRGMLGS